MITNKTVTNNESLKDDAQLDQASITLRRFTYTCVLMTKRYRLTFVIAQNGNGSDREVHVEEHLLSSWSRPFTR